MRTKEAQTMEQNLYLVIGLIGAIAFFFGFMTGKTYERYDEED